MDKDARIAALEAENASLRRRLAALEATVAALRKNSRTSSKPPSSDIVKPPPESPDERPKGGGGAGGGSKRKIGGQPGHDKHARVPFPPDRIDAAWVYDWADAGDSWEPLDEFYIHQQVELRESPLIVTEHRFRRYRHRVSGRTRRRAARRERSPSASARTPRRTSASSTMNASNRRTTPPSGRCATR